MRIALVIDTVVGGGSEGVVRRLAVGLARRGHRIFTYCLKTAGQSGAQLRDAGVVVREADSFGRDPLLPWRLGRWLHQDRVDIVHAHSCAALVSVFPAAKVLGIPLVHVRHGWPLGRPGWHTRLAERLSPFVDCIGINCESGRARLPRGPVARRAVHVPNGVEVDTVAPPEARRLLEQFCGRRLSGAVVLSVANIRIEKDFRGLLRAFDLLRRQRPDATLVCVGKVKDPAYWEQVRGDLRDLNLDRRVLFPGYSDNASRLMAGADALCLASRTEAMPNVVLEAMAQRVPIVATAVGDVGRLGPGAAAPHFLLHHSRTGLLVPPGDPAALAEALRFALADPGAARERAERAAAKYAQRYTTAHMVRRYEQLYADCLQSAGKLVRSPAPPADANRTRPAVLMLGPAPPLVGGMVTSIGLLLKSPLRERFELQRFATTIDLAAATGSDVHSGRSPAGVLFRSLARHVGSLWQLGRVLLNQRIRLVHIHTCSYFTFYRNLLDLALAKLLRRPVILHIRGGRFEHFYVGSSPLGRRLIRRGLEWADGVIVLSRGWHRALCPHTGNARLFVVPNAFDPDVIAAPEPAGSARLERDRADTDRPCRFLFLAPLTEAKGVGDLIEAARIVQNEGTPFELVIAGPATPTQRARWQRRVNKARLAEVVTFAGPVTGAAKARLLASADCLVHPSHSEGLPNSVLEAGAAGLPVIATAVGAVPEVLLPPDPETGQPRPTPLTPMVQPHDPAAFAHEMKRLACDAGLRQRIGRVLREEFTANYSIARLAERVARVYERILARRAAARAVSPEETASPVPVGGPSNTVAAEPPVSHAVPSAPQVVVPSGAGSGHGRI